MPMPIDEMFELYSHVVFRYLYSLCPNSALCEDLLQDTFVQAIRHADSFREESSPSTWLCAIARNEWKKYCRKNPIVLPLDEQSVSSNYIADPRLPDSQMLKLIHSLKEPFREILYLRLYGSLSFKQIGEIFDRSENWARITFFRARQMVRKEADACEKYD